MTRTSRAYMTALVFAGTLLLSFASPQWAHAAGGKAVESCVASCDDVRAKAGAHYTADADCDGSPNWRDSVVDCDDGPRPATSADYYVVKDVGFHAFNLLVLVGIIVFFIRRPLSDFLGARALKIRTEIKDSQEERDKALKRRDEVEARLGSLEQEVADIAAEAERAAKRQQESLMQRAQQEAEHIAKTAERNIRDEVDRARDNLRKEAIEIAVDLAKNALTERVSSDDQRRLARDILDALEEKEESGDV